MRTHVELVLTNKYVLYNMKYMESNGSTTLILQRIQPDLGRSGLAVAHPAVVRQNSGSNHAADSSVHCDSHCDMQS